MLNLNLVLASSVEKLRARVCSGRGTNSPELRVVSKNPRVI